MLHLDTYSISVYYVLKLVPLHMLFSLITMCFAYKLQSFMYSVIYV